MIKVHIDDESLFEKGLTAEEVKNGIVLAESQFSAGFNLTTNIDGYNPVYNFFLCEGKIISKDFIK